MLENKGRLNDNVVLADDYDGERSLYPQQSPAHLVHTGTMECHR